MEFISSRQNPLVTLFRGAAGGYGEETTILLDGEHLLDEAFASDVPVDVVAFEERHAGERLAGLVHRAQAAGARVVLVTEAVLAAMSPVRNPSGVVALARRPVVSLADSFADAPQLVLILCDVQDPGNVGAAIRTAEACGATGVVTGDTTAGPFGWKALRGAMGSSLRLPVASGQPWDVIVAAAREAGVRLLAAVPRDGTPVPAADLTGPCAILLGGEGAGVPAGALDDADERVTIPMRRSVESLNVAIAAALILYEASRQRAPIAAE